METTIVYWGYIGMMEDKMETIMVYCYRFGVGTLNPKSWEPARGGELFRF